MSAGGRRPTFTRALLRPSVLLGLYTLLLLYGSLYPFDHWRAPGHSPWLLMLPKGRHQSYSDALTNLLVYIPFGFLLARSLWQRAGAGQGIERAARNVLIAALAGGALSLGVEYVQAYNPARVSSFIDTALNLLGSGAGALTAAAIRADSLTGRWLLDLRRRYVVPGPLADLGLLALGLWVLSQLTPLVPSIDVGSLRAGLKPLWHTLTGDTPFDAAHSAVYALSVAGLALLFRTLSYRRRHSLLLFAALVAAVLILKVPVVSRQLSLEAVAGAAAGLAGAGVLRLLGRRVRPVLAAALIIASVCVSELRPGTTAVYHAFNWIPFRGQLSNDLIGLADIVTDLWPFLALSYLVLLNPPRRPALTASVGAVGLFALMFALEWHQQSLPGRVPDITDAVIAVAAWLAPWLRGDWAVPQAHGTQPAAAGGTTRAGHGHRRRHRRPRASARTWLVLLALSIGAAVAAVSLTGRNGPVEKPLDESVLPKLPAPSDLPPVNLPGFRYGHPRLPAPGPGDIAALRARNPDFLHQQIRRGAGGRGPLRAAIFSAYVKPGSVDLQRLYQRLMALQFQWRGQGQVKPLAMGYDWLYDRWGDAQRTALRDKLVKGCNYIIHRIRYRRLSPYNVYLYNSPFQALVACAIASYGDTPAADPVMRFTDDLWKHRVLPVWRQIMGRNGGWHEGGEYVGIGIGQAVYQVPAMWRKATGEDLFKQYAPQLHGFLDFLIYRTRPDKDYFHWGDAGHFHRAVPDRVPLAMEYRDKAAYSLHGKPHFTPTAWPWGPLPDQSLYDPGAIARLPLTRVFDGIGMVVTRSDWSPGATYVTFKAGDNYWSHTHLDQGAFTIYKGGALAIDSGLYGHYDSDHHMDYDYQTIAHNTITVKDPADTVPAPAKPGKKPRSIANDGGQRRVGSGWGVYAAPLDLADWKAHRALYHTGTLQRVFDRDGLVIALADVTPAYTNGYSGTGTFTNRTRRVERFWRIFAYDRNADAVVIFDQVRATRAGFRKRWLLHTIERPRRTADGFVVSVPPTDATGHGGGRLEGHVLLPRNPDIQFIGGKGFRFYVDGHNYDGDGWVEAAAERRGNHEVGNWRVEVYPSVQRRTQDFLTVLLPSPLNRPPALKVRRLEDGKRVGCEIAGAARTTRWWFTPGTNRVEVTVRGAGRTRHYAVAPPASP